MTQKRYKYFVKVPVMERYDYFYEITASNDKEAIDKYMSGDTDDEHLEFLSSYDDGDPVILKKEEIK